MWGRHHGTCHWRYFPSFLMIISFCFCPNCDKAIANNLCTCHDSTAVVAFAKFCCDVMNRNRIKGTRIYRIWKATKKAVSGTDRSAGPVLQRFVCVRNTTYGRACSIPNTHNSIYSLHVWKDMYNIRCTIFCTVWEWVKGQYDLRLYSIHWWLMIWYIFRVTQLINHRLSIGVYLLMLKQHK